MGRISFSLLIAALVFGGLSLSTKAKDAPEIPPMVTFPDGSKTQKGAKDEDGKWVLTGYMSKSKTSCPSPRPLPSSPLTRSLPLAAA